MQTVTVKFKENVLHEMDESIQKNNFNSRTEFVREAVRDKMRKLSTDQIIREFGKFYGKSKKTTYKEDRQYRKILSDELAKELKENL